MANHLGELTDSSMKNLQGLIDSNAVIGREIVTADGTTILPISKVSFGFGSGGSDLPSSQKELFGGASGAGVSITPIGFLVVRDGNVKLLQIQGYNNTADRLVEMVPDVVDKVSGVINNFRSKKEEEPAVDEPVPDEE